MVTEEKTLEKRSAGRAMGVLPCASGKRCTCAALCGGCNIEVMRYAFSVLLGGAAMRVRKLALLLRAVRPGGTSDVFTPSACATTFGGVSMSLRAQASGLFRGRGQAHVHRGTTPTC